MQVHITYFGAISVRFMRRGVLAEAPYVMYRDFAVALRACMTGMPDDMKQIIVDTCTRLIIVDGDKAHGVEGTVVEPLLNVIAAMEILRTIESLQGENKEPLRESGRRAHALFTWMLHAIIDAEKALGYGAFDSLHHFKARLDKASPSFDIAVFHDSESGMWIALNDTLPVATEAPTYEALVDRVWLIAPEIAVENGLREREDDVRLSFRIMSGMPITKAL